MIFSCHCTENEILMSQYRHTIMNLKLEFFNRKPRRFTNLVLMQSSCKLDCLLKRLIQPQYYPAGIGIHSICGLNSTASTFIRMYRSTLGFHSLRTYYTSNNVSYKKGLMGVKISFTGNDLPAAGSTSTLFRECYKAFLTSIWPCVAKLTISYDVLMPNSPNISFTLGSAIYVSDEDGYLTEGLLLRRIVLSD